MIDEVNGYAYTLFDDALWVRLFGSNQLVTTTSNGDELRVTQESNYLRDGHITLTIEQPTTIQALVVRIQPIECTMTLKSYICSLATIRQHAIMTPTYATNYPLTETPILISPLSGVCQINS